ncbi:hypothetical protein GCM10023116_36700 [Kistimonas scapharcae]|uniref:Uncharacterized protein n=2 Tax=Kistimonas scapharcae TaxID=1036133 RepID=A0ABP8V663_9GAMM
MLPETINDIEQLRKEIDEYISNACFLAKLALSRDASFDIKSETDTIKRKTQSYIENIQKRERVNEDQLAEFERFLENSIENLNVYISYIQEKPVCRECCPTCVSQTAEQCSRAIRATLFFNGMCCCIWPVACAKGSHNTIEWCAHLLTCSDYAGNRFPFDPKYPFPFDQGKHIKNACPSHGKRYEHEPDRVRM